MVLAARGVDFTGVDIDSKTDWYYDWYSDWYYDWYYW